ncbi:uncharacterized protein LOC143279365 [Babylonia areolata]|uniref:uncharacterized protein LOC143279365 n=1 Tax=Babylonia areolata TaxID=304850 RepID=UPI003FD5B104
MAGFRFRKRVFILLLAVSFVSMIYLLSLLPQKDDMLFPGQLKHHPLTKSPKNSVSVTGKYVTTQPPNGRQDALVMNVLGSPQLQLVDHSKHKNFTVVNNGNDTKAMEAEHISKTPEKDSGGLIKNRTDELGGKLLNKTVAIEKIKNKTLEHLGVLTRQAARLVFVPRKWNLTVSFEDIGDIMKETQFLNKVDPLNLDGPILVSSRNRTANFTYSMPLKFGYCDCFERYCVCCSPVSNKRLHLNSTACSNFTFISKTHELDLKFFMDGKLIHKALITADKSPMLCLGSVPKVADVCVHFFNMTFRVNEHNEAQTQLLGCTDLSLNLYNRTIGAFPVDCFQIPGDPNKAHRERNFNMIFNWVP